MSKEKSPNILPIAITVLGGVATHFALKLQKSSVVRKDLEARLTEATELATRDSLTNLYTRRALEERYQELQSAEKRQRATDAENQPTKSSLVLLDVDHFKRVNDTLGHDMGDEVLRNVANILRNEDLPTRLSPEDPDYAGRWGGEEMVLLVTNKTEEDAVKVAEDVRQRIESAGQVTASMGVVELDLSQSLENNIAMADQALYFAKHNGRNQIIPYSSLPPTSAT
ncbi:MAG: hypothetical protein JWL89_595 [Candidatus Saccharibacteria bacterium]|nr:hypothetical protein [Candidatus Saccharibacteria bacterium]